MEDLVRFAEALRNHKLLNAEHTKLLTTGKVDARFPDTGTPTASWMRTTAARIGSVTVEDLQG